jgi:dihydrofolate reductase
MSYSIIAAVGRNLELGKNNDLIWNIPGDLKFFRSITSGHTIIMGRNTFDSLPKMLPNRKHIVLSSKEDFPSEVEVYKNLKDLLLKYKDCEEEIFIIGGGSIYSLFLEYCDKLYLTEIDEEDKSASVYFPSFDKELYNEEVLGSNEDNGISYKHVLYIRK